MKKLTTDQFVERAKEIHGEKYDYSSALYVNRRTKICIICKEHGEFLQMPENHIIQKQGCPKCVGRNRTTEEFISDSKRVHNNFYGYDNSVCIGTTKKIEITCPIHGSFWQLADLHLKGFGCNNCGIERNKISQRNSLSNFVSKADALHDKKYIYEKAEYKNSATKLEIICRIHGSFWQKPNDHLTGYGCPECGFERMAASRRLSLDDFITRSKDSHAGKYNYSNVVYENSAEKIEIICQNHGSFWQIPMSHMLGAGCPKCKSSISKKEQIWLDYHNIPDDRKHRQVLLSFNGGRKYKVDGYNPETNTVYEFWGDYWHGNPKTKGKNPNDMNKRSKKTFGQLYEETQQKIKDIESSGYNLVQIWESDFKLP